MGLSLATMAFVGLGAVGAVAFADARTRESAERSERRIAALNTSIAATRRRIALLEESIPLGTGAALGATRVAGPFEVDDGDHAPIVIMSDKSASSERGFELLSATGEKMIVVSADTNGGSVKVGGADHKRFAVLSSGDSAASIALKDGDQTQGSLSLTPSGLSRLSIKNSARKLIVELTEGIDKAGEMTLFDQNGEPRVDAGIALTGEVAGEAWGSAGEVKGGPRMQCEFVEGLRVPSCIRGHPPGAAGAH
jgi:hypothetical protein